MGNSCFLWFHDWQKWGDIFETQFIETHERFGLVVVPLSQPVEYTEDRQQRTCNRCGQVQERTI